MANVSFNIACNVILKDFWGESCLWDEYLVNFQLADSAGNILDDVNITIDNTGYLEYECTVDESIWSSLQFRVKADHWLAQVRWVWPWEAWGPPPPAPPSMINHHEIDCENGDLNNDNIIDVIDYAIFGEYYNNQGTGGTLPPGDCNGDGELDIADYAIIAANYNMGGMEFTII